MNTRKKLLCLLSLTVLFGCQSVSQEETPSPEPSAQVFQEESRILSFNEDWKFSFQQEDAFEIDTEDSSWETITLPHDYSITQSFDVANEAESGFLPGGEGWYRKTFTLSSEDVGKQVRVFFGGVYQNCVVYCNGQYLGRNPYGYTTFGFNLTPYVEFDENKENVIAVQVENDLPNSRWYTGSGIEQNVTLLITSPCFIDEQSIYITSPKLETQKNGTVDTSIEVPIQNEEGKSKDVTVLVSIMDKDGNVVGQSEETTSAKAHATTTVPMTVSVSSPSLWSTDSPTLYTVQTQLYEGEELMDQVTTSFGYRYYAFSNENGFTLNGQPMKLQGMCMHMDQGALGAVENKDAIMRQLEKMKEMGVNAIRVSHHPASTTLLECCDQLGILVIEEAFDTWLLPKNENWNDASSFFTQTIEKDNTVLYGETGMTYAQLAIQAMVRHSRNHPSVFLYSIGNEILGNIYGDTSGYPKVAADLCDWVQELDTTRLLTIGDNKIMKDDPIQIAMDQAIIDHGGIIGLNYATANDYDALHEKYPDWIFYASETSSQETSRDYYASYGADETTYQVSSQYPQAPIWGERAEVAWQDVASRPFIAGEFVWTGFDYLGEPEPWNGLMSGSVSGLGPFPRSSYFGQCDTAGLEKDGYYYYQSQWNLSVHTLHILPTWNQDEIVIDANGYVQVTVYSDAPHVELFLNDALVGSQESPSGIFTFPVLYEEGTLRAVAKDASGNEITNTQGRNQVSTTGEVASILPTVSCNDWSADGKSLCYVTIQAMDASNHLVTSSDIALSFEVKGEATLVGMDNGNPTDISSFQGSDDQHGQKSLYHGQLVVILQSTNTAGMSSVTITTDTLPAVSQTLTSK